MSETTNDLVGWIAKTPGSQPISLIHFLFDKFNFTYNASDIESTGNGMWFKAKIKELPGGHYKKQDRLLSLLGMMANNAISESKQRASFLLWSDIRGQWYFKTVQTLINQNKSAPIRLFLSQNETTQDFTNKILSVVDDSLPTNIAERESKIFASNYLRIDPDYTNKYIDFNDSNQGLTQNRVSYSIIKDTQRINVRPHYVNYEEISKTPVNETNTFDFGYFDLESYNLPNPVWWEHLGYGKDIKNNISWKPQYDITSISFPLFHKIHTKIKLPLAQKRLEFNRLRNIKRKWEAYRCTVCCMDQPIGSSEDTILFQNLATQTPIIVNGVSYDVKKLLGENGLFLNKPMEHDYLNIGSSVGPYQVVAAGAVTDGINYDAERLDWQNGLTFAIDLSKPPYNETISQFYHLNPNFESTSYYTEVITKGLQKYDDKIAENNARIQIIRDFGSKIDLWITAAIEFIGGYLVPCSHCIEFQDKNNSVMDINNYWTWYRHMSNEHIPDYRGREIGSPTYPCGYRPEFGGPDIPVWSGIMSGGQAGTEPVLESTDPNTGLTGPILEIEGIGKVPYFRIPQYTCLRTINFNHEWSSSQPNEIDTDYKEIYQGLVPNLPRNYGPVHGEEDDTVVGPSWVKEIYEDKFMRGKDAGLTFQGMEWRMKEKCIGRACYNEYAFNPNVLYALKQIAIRQLNILRVENLLLNKVKTEILTGLAGKLQTAYNKWQSRKAFFHSKQPGTSIFRGSEADGFRGTTLTQPISLQGIKRVTRKPIRGSRYEILAKAKGITGASMGQWLYNIWFDNESPQTYSGNTANPYYKQGYRQNWLYFDRKQFRQTQKQSKIQYYTNRHTQDRDTQFLIKLKTYETSFYGVTGDGLIVETDPRINQLESYTVFNIDQSKRPPNLKREEIASYVRIEFTTPIGLDRIQDFPNGFVRDMGSEYFLPYIVSLTPGPSGRQSIRNNVAVIGMDPYGFDIAVKKGKVESRYDHRNTWFAEGGNPEITQTELSRNGMDLWPEPMFETRYPYYAEDPRQMWSYSDSYTGIELPKEQWYGKELGKQRSADVDPERRKTHMGSGLLMGSHRKIKPHRSWWSIHLPKNIFISQKLYSQLTTDLSNVWRHGHHNYTNLPGDPYDGWLNFLNSSDIRGQIMDILGNDRIS